MRATILLLAPFIFLLIFSDSTHVSQPYVRIEQMAASYNLSLSFTLRDSELKTICSSPHLDKAWASNPGVNIENLLTVRREESAYLDIWRLPHYRAVHLDMWFSARDFRPLLLLRFHLANFRRFFSTRTSERLRDCYVRFMFPWRMDFHSALRRSHTWHVKSHEWS